MTLLKTFLGLAHDRQFAFSDLLSGFSDEYEF